MALEELANLVVREAGLSEERLEDALQRQVLQGGQLDTVLLEMGLIDEATLLGLLARASGLPAVGRDAIDRAATSALHLFPRRLAEKHGIIPLELTGRRLTVAVSQAPDLALLDEIGFMLSVYVRPVVTTEARIAYALFHLYRVPLPARIENLLGLLGEDPEEARRPAEAPEPAPAPASAAAGWQVAAQAIVDRTVETGGVAGPAIAASTLLGDVTREAAGADAADDGLQGPGEEEPPAGPAEAPAADEEDAPGAMRERVAIEDLDENAPDFMTAPVQPGNARLREEARERLFARLDAEEEAEVRNEEQRRVQRVRWTVDDAIAELALADDRDAMLDVALRFAYRRLRTAAIFVVQRLPGHDGVVAPAFVGWDIIDPQLGRRDITRLVLPVEGEHGLAQLWRIRSHFLGPLKDADPLLAALGRIPRAALLVPILVGDHLAGVLYGDCGERPIPPLSLAELHMVVPRLGKGLRNLILRRKGGREAPSPVAVAPRAKEGAIPAIDLDLDDFETDFEAPLAVAEDELDVEVAREHVDIQEPVAEIDEALERIEATSAGSFAARAAPRRPLDDGLDDDAPEPAAWPARPPPVPGRVRDARVVAPQDSTPDVFAAEQDAALPAATSPHLDSVLAASERVAAQPAEANLPRDSLPAAAPAASPGAAAKETLLLATWRTWLEHEDPELEELMCGLHQPGEAGRNAVAEVCALGERAMPALARYFPGAFTVHPFGVMDARPEVSELSDACACLVRLKADLAAPILVGELAHDDRLHRYAAVWALSELVVPAALPRLAQRVFDPELRIALLALEVLERYRDQPAFPKVLASLRDLCRRGDTFQRSRAVLAAAELRDRGALEALVNLLGARPKEIAEEAREALVSITGQDFRLSERRWRAWIADHQDKPRLRWLIDALRHKDLELREAARLELDRLTGKDFGYRAAAPRREREAAVMAWGQWWTEQAPGAWP